MERRLISLFACLHVWRLCSRGIVSAVITQFFDWMMNGKLVKTSMGSVGVYKETVVNLKVAWYTVWLRIGWIDWTWHNNSNIFYQMFFRRRVDILRIRNASNEHNAHPYYTKKHLSYLFYDGLNKFFSENFITKKWRLNYFENRERKPV